MGDEGTLQAKAEAWDRWRALGEEWMKDDELCRIPVARFIGFGDAIEHDLGLIQQNNSQVEDDRVPPNSIRHTNSQIRNDNAS